MNRPIYLPLALAMLLSACVTTPAQLQGTYSAIEPEQAAKQEVPGEAVSWGGKIVDVHTEKLFTCFEIVGAPLDSSGRPREVDDSNGRFLACRDGFYEPEVFKEGRELTISGKIDGYETRKVGDYDYRYPRVAAEVVYLWPERIDHDYHDHYHGYWGPGWGWGWGWYGGPWW